MRVGPARAYLILTVAVVLAILLGLAISVARAHDWYEPTCRFGTDCIPACKEHS